MQLLEYLRSAAPEGIKVSHAAARLPLTIHMTFVATAATPRTQVNLRSDSRPCVKGALSALKSLLKGSEATPAPRGVTRAPAEPALAFRRTAT